MDIQNHAIYEENQAKNTSEKQEGSQYSKKNNEEFVSGEITDSGSLDENSSEINEVIEKARDMSDAQKKDDGLGVTPEIPQEPEASDETERDKEKKLDEENKREEPIDEPEIPQEPEASDETEKDKDDELGNIPTMTPEVPQEPEASDETEKEETLDKENKIEEPIDEDPITQEYKKSLEEDLGKKKDKFAFSDEDSVKDEDCDKNKNLFVKPDNFIPTYNNLKSERWFFLLGPKHSGKKVFALRLAAELKEECHLTKIYQKKSIPEECIFDIDYLLSLKDAVIIFPGISKENFTVGQYLKTFYPDKNEFVQKLVPKLKDNNSWLILTLESDEPTEESRFNGWAREHGNWKYLDILPDLHEVYRKKEDELINQCKEIQKQKHIYNLSDKLAKEYISFGKENKKLIHLKTAAEIVRFFDKNFINILESLSSEDTLNDERLKSFLKEKAYDFCSQKEETKAWFDKLEPEDKCAVVAVTLFDNCSWPIFWDLHEQIRNILFPPLSKESDKELEKNESKKDDYIIELNPLQSFRKDDNLWLEKIHAHVKNDSKTGAHVVDFVQSDFREEILAHLLYYHRYELSKIAISLIEQVNDGHYSRRWAIARGLGRIGELDFTILIVPAIKTWIGNDRDVRKATIIHLYNSILNNSKNQWYHKKALSYIEKELAQGSPIPDQWIAIMLCKEIGMWNESYLENALNLLYNIIKQQWNLPLDNVSSLHETIINAQVTSIFIRTLMHTLREFSFHHTPIPIIECMLKWIRGDNDKVKMFVALIAFTDEELGIPWQYCDKDLLSIKSSHDIKFNDQFLQTICAQKAYRNIVRDIIVQILNIEESHFLTGFLFERVFRLIYIWLKETQYTPQIRSEIQILIKGIQNRLIEDKPASRTLSMELQRWKKENILFVKQEREVIS